MGIFNHRGCGFWPPGLAPLVQRADNSIHWINLYPVDGELCFVIIFLLDSNLSSGQQIGWFQKISIPIPRVASRNSEGEGGLRRLEFRGHGGGSLDWNSEGMGGDIQGKLIKNDLSKDDDSLVNTRHVQLNQHAGRTFQWSWSI